MFQKTEVLKKGFTIIEILLSGAIGLLLLFVMANAFFNFQKIALMQNDNAKKHASFERTLMMLKSELIQAGYGLASYASRNSNYGSITAYPKRHEPGW